MTVDGVLECVSEGGKAYNGPYGCNIYLEQTATHIGRNPVLEPGYVNLPTNWAQVSANHCCITYADGKYTIKDTSSNGTFVNGDKITKNVAHPLIFGDQVGLATRAASKAFEYIFRQHTPEEAAAARKRKAETVLKVPAGGVSPGRSGSKRAKVSPPPDGPLPRGPSAERAVADAGLAQALHDLQKQNQAERARRTEEQGKREEAERKLREAEALHAAELKAVEESAARKAAEERKFLQAQIVRSKADVQAAADGLAVKEAELAASNKRIHEQEERLKKQSSEIERLQETVGALTEEQEHLKSELEGSKAAGASLQRKAAEQSSRLAEAEGQLHGAVAELEAERAAVAGLRDEVLRLRAEIQAKEHAEQRARDGEAEAAEALKVKVALLQSAACSYMGLADRLANDQRQLEQAMEAMRARREELKPLQEGLCRSLALATGQELAPPAQMGQCNNHTQAAARVTDDTSMATQEYGQDDDDSVTTSRVSPAIKSPRRPEPVAAPTQVTPSGSFALVPTLEPGVLPDDTPQFVLPTLVTCAPPAPACVPDSEPQRASIPELGAQRPSISLALENGGDGPCEPGPLRLCAAVDDDEDVDDLGSGSDSQLSSERKSGMASGDENVDVRNSLEYGTGGSSAVKKGMGNLSAQKPRFPGWGADANLTLHESELMGME